jgi:hypothetical protein
LVGGFFVVVGEATRFLINGEVVPLVCEYVLGAEFH